MKKLVVKLGGSLLFDDDGNINADRIKGFAEILVELKNKDGYLPIVVVGGGVIARKYISISRKFHASETFNDELGIEVSRINARLLMAALGEEAFPDIPKNVKEVAKAFESQKIVVMGGTEPGHSTNAVAALMADYFRAEMLINATSVDGVYTSPPKKDLKAKKLDEVSIEKLKELMLTSGVRAGEYELFDLVAISIVERAKIITKIINGKNPENILKAIRGEKIGTSVIFSD